VFTPLHIRCIVFWVSSSVETHTNVSEKPVLSSGLKNLGLFEDFQFMNVEKCVCFQI